MLSAEAVRLIAIEILSPTAANITGTGFPTLAGKRVFDSRAPLLEDIDSDRDYTPVISVYTRRSATAPRGPASDFTDFDATTVLEVVAELATVVRDPEARPGQDPDYVDAMADGDAAARLVLAALAGQIRFLLTRSEHGAPWRRLVRQVNNFSIETFAIPEFGLRYQRQSLVFDLSIRDDDFQMEAGGLPEPLRSVAASLPDGSYAKAKLAELAGYFLAETSDALDTIAGTVKLPGAREITAGWSADA